MSPLSASRKSASPESPTPNTPATNAASASSSQPVISVCRRLIWSRPEGAWLVSRSSILAFSRRALGEGEREYRAHQHRRRDEDDDQRLDDRDEVDAHAGRNLHLPSAGFE